MLINKDNGDWGLGIGDWGLGIGDWEFKVNIYDKNEFNK
jgi:hypothetical protein